MDNIWILGPLLPLGILIWSSQDSKLKKLQRKIKKLEKRTKGKNLMSEMLKELIGKKPMIQMENGLGLADYEVLAVDSDWIKLRRVNKKGQVSTKLLRLDDLLSVELLEN